MSRLPLVAIEDSNTIPGQFVTDYQELTAIWSHLEPRERARCYRLGLPFKNWTAAIVDVANGDYSSLYITDDGRPYQIGADFYQII